MAAPLRSAEQRAPLPAWQRYGIALGIGLYLTKVVATLRWNSLANYPVTFPDSFDWLTNGLYYSGVPLEPTWRSALNPLIYAGLFSLRLENAIPYLGPLYFGATLALLLTIGRRAAGDAAVFAAVLAGTNHFLLTHALVIGSDVLAIGLATAAMLVFHLGREQPRPAPFLLAGVLLGSGFLAQPAAQLLAPALVAVFFYESGRGFRALGTRLRQTATSPLLWSTAAAALLTIVAVFTLRWVICGHFRPRPAVPHHELLTISIRNLRYYLWSSVGLWSIPTTLLALAGLVAGWRTHPRVVLGTVLAVVANAIFFVVLYGWRDNRFVLYWTFPVFLLAGFALAAMPRRVAWVVLAGAVYWGNLTYITEPGPDRTALVWLPGRATVQNYATEALESPATSIVPFTRRLRAWSREREKGFSNPTRDDPGYSREGDVVGQLTALHTQPFERVFLHIGPDEASFRPYMLQNQFSLSARRAVRVVRLDPRGTPGLPRRAPVILRRQEFDRLSAAGLPFTPVEIRPIYCLVRLGPPPP